MWICKICDSEVEDDTWEACWHCSSLRNLDPADVKELRKAHEKKAQLVLNCLRCELQMVHAGTRRFRHEESFSLSILGFNLSPDLLDYRYDIYICRNCGKVEFFIDGVGDELRGEHQGP